MWLLEQTTRDAMQAAQTSGVAPTAEQISSYDAMCVSASADTGSHILVIAGNVAEIAVKGVLTKRPDFLAMFFGGGNTTYAEIMSAINIAETDPAITDIIFDFDSPGGSIDGLFDTISAIQNMKKRKRGNVSNMGASAAYALLAQMDTITASNKATRVGSIGILASFNIDEDSVTITSSNAPKKAPDVTTDEGRAMVVEELDALHEIFVDSIASGRSVTVDQVNNSFGRGGTLLAGKALERGMIDDIESESVIINTPTAKGGENIKVKNMDLATLQAEHPATYNAAIAVGVEQGINSERDRVGQHLIMGESSGDMKTALAACKDGTEMTGVMQSTYLAAGMNRNDLNDRNDDDTSVAAAADNAKSGGTKAKGQAELDAIEIANGLAAMTGIEGVA